MAEDPGLTIIDLGAPPATSTPKRPAKKAAASKTAPPKKKPGRSEPAMTVIDLDSRPKPEPEPVDKPPLIPPEDVPEHLDPKDGDRVTPNSALVGVVIDPPMTALKMKIKGKQWWEIAQLTGYKTGADVQKAVETVMARAAAEQGAYNRTIALALSVTRHEELMSAWWDMATEECEPAAALVVSRELAQLDKIQRVGEIDSQAGQHGPRIVIAGNEADYVKGLQDVYAQQNAPHGELPPGRGETIDG